MSIYRLTGISHLKIIIALVIAIQLVIILSFIFHSNFFIILKTTWNILIGDQNEAKIIFL